MSKQFINELRIIELLIRNYGIQTQLVQLLDLGADANALVYKANAKSASYFVKLKYGYYDEMHIAIIKLLHDAGIKEIIFPLHTINGELFQQLDNCKMIVYPYIDGQNGFERDLTKKQWIQLGKTLKNIHEISLPFAIQKQVRKETYSPKWREMIRSLYSKIEIDVSDDEMTVDFKQFFKQHMATIQQLVNTAGELAKKIQSDVNNYVLCHSDIHAGNILLTTKPSFYIVDWDDPMMAPKERDLMFIGGGVGNVWNKPQETEFFYEGYGNQQIDKIILSYYRHERIVEDIAVYSEDILSGLHNQQSKLVMFKHFKAMFEPNGVVDIAFSMNQLCI